MNAAELKKLLSQAKSEIKTSAKTIKPQPGQNRYVLLPAQAGGDYMAGFYHGFGQHYVKNAAGEVQAVAVCQNATFGKPCTVCDGLAHAIAHTTDENTLKMLQEANSGKRFLVNVLALDSDSPAEPQLLELSGTAFNGILTNVEEWGEEIFKMGESRILVITREGKGLNTKYAVTVSSKSVTVPAGVYAKVQDIKAYVSRENDEGRNKALSAMRGIAGGLPAPAAAPAARERAASRVADDSGKAATADDIGLDAELDALLADAQ